MTKELKEQLLSIRILRDDLVNVRKELEEKSKRINKLEAEKDLINKEINQIKKDYPTLEYDIDKLQKRKKEFENNQDKIINKNEEIEKLKLIENPTDKKEALVKIDELKEDIAELIKKNKEIDFSNLEEYESIKKNKENLSIKLSKIEKAINKENKENKEKKELEKTKKELEEQLENISVIRYHGVYGRMVGAISDEKVYYGYVDDKEGIAKVTKGFLADGSINTSDESGYFRGECRYNNDDEEIEDVHIFPEEGFGWLFNKKEDVYYPYKSLMHKSYK